MLYSSPVYLIKRVPFLLLSGFSFLHTRFIKSGLQSQLSSVVFYLHCLPELFIFHRVSQHYQLWASANSNTIKRAYRQDFLTQSVPNLHCLEGAVMLQISCQKDSSQMSLWSFLVQLLSQFHARHFLSAVSTYHVRSIISLSQLHTIPCFSLFS